MLLGFRAKSSLIFLFYFDLVLSLFLIQSNINDAAEFKEVSEAMKVIGFKPEELQTVHKILATILHLVSRCETCGMSIDLVRWGHSTDNPVFSTFTSC